MISHEIGRYVDAKLLLPHVSVTVFTSDSTSKPAPRKQGYKRCQPPSSTPQTVVAKKTGQTHSSHLSYQCRFLRTSSEVKPTLGCKAAEGNLPLSLPFLPAFFLTILFTSALKAGSCTTSFFSLTPCHLVWTVSGSAARPQPPG